MRIKAFTADQVVREGEERTLTATISTGDLDRENDRINPHGFDFSGFIQNPVVLFAHRYDIPPVAKALEIGVSGDQVWSEMEFATKDDFELADTVYRLYCGGYMRAFSIGFVPMETERNAEGGFDFASQELLEFSAVPVPANPHALVAAKAAGIDVSPVREWAEMVLDSCGGEEASYWLPRKTLEDTYRSSSARSSFPSSGWRSEPDLLDSFEWLSASERKALLWRALRVPVFDEAAKVYAAKTGRLP